MTETLHAAVDGYQLTLQVKLIRSSKSGWPVYNLGTQINEQPLYEQRLPPRVQVQLLKAGLALLDQWCIDHPHSFLATYEWSLADFGRQFYRWGAACDGRVETWFTCVDDSGHRTLYPGVLNLIEDCLDICDLWRVAKDTDYFLGNLETPLDVFNQILVRAGIRNLLESGYAFEGDFQALFQEYSDRLQESSQDLYFDQHGLGGEKWIRVCRFEPQYEPNTIEYRFFYSVQPLAALTPTHLVILRPALKLPFFSTETEESRAEHVATQILALNPAQAMNTES